MSKQLMKMKLVRLLQHSGPCNTLQRLRLVNLYQKINEPFGKFLIKLKYTLTEWWIQTTESTTWNKSIITNTIFKAPLKKIIMNSFWTFAQSKGKTLLDLLNKEQRFICNIDFRMNKNPPIFLFLNQTIANLDIFCTMRAPFNYFSPVPTDTT